MTASKRQARQIKLQKYFMYCVEEEYFLSFHGDSPNLLVTDLF